MISMTLPQCRRRECVIYGRKVRLTAMLTKALCLMLVAGPDRFVSRTEFIEALWPNPDLEPKWANTMVGRCMTGLRRKGVIIETHWGVGWRIPRFAREEIPERLAA